jgi:hypothetical protein
LYRFIAAVVLLLDRYLLASVLSWSVPLTKQHETTAEDNGFLAVRAPILRLLVGLWGAGS